VAPVSPGLVCGLDVATQDVRALVVDGTGRVRAEGKAPLPAPERPGEGRAEQDARAWWPAACDALRQATSKLDSERDAIRALAISATSGTLVAVDAGGEPVGPAPMYDDRRGGEAAAAAQAAGAERLARLGMTLAAGSGVARMGWLAHSEAAPRIAGVRHTSEFLGERLCGAPVPADWSHTLKSGYDPQAEEWALEALAAAGVDPEWLPPVAAPTTPVGAVSAAAAEATGLPEGCELRLGMTDGCAAQLACGAAAPGRFMSVLGTTLVQKGVTETLLRDPAGAVYCHRHPDGFWLPGGASNTGCEALAATPRERLGALDDAARARGPASMLAYPLARAGERYPFVAPDARGFTQGEPEDEADAHRAALEGVACLEKLGFERLEALGAQVRGPVASAGGGSRSAVWSAIRATVLDRELELARHAETGFGAALLAAAGSLHPDLGAATAAMVHAAGTVEPVAGEVAALQERYGAFVAALEARGWLDAGS